MWKLNMASDGVVEEDKREDATTSDNEEREEESKDGIVKRKGKTTGGMMFDGEERKVKRRKTNKEKDDVLARCENEREVKKRKKDRRDLMMLSGDKETKVKKKKKVEKVNVVVAGIEGKKISSLTGMVRDDMKAQNKEKKRKGKQKDTEDVVVAGHEEHNKLKDRKENKKEEVKKRKKNKEKGDVLDGHENEREVKKRKKEKKMKKKEKDDVVAGIEEKKAERKKKKMRDDMKTHNKEKKRKRKQKDTEDVVVAGHEEQNKPKNKKEEVKISGSQNDNEDGLVQGKRFSEEENELIKKAVSEYIEANQLGDEGLDMVLECKYHPHVKGCWQEIGAALPWRPYRSVYQRARRLYMRGEGKWTPEEVEHIRKSYEKYGSKWKRMADELGKYHVHVRNAFQRYQFGNLKKGKWSQHEYQTLFELVNKDLLMNVLEEKKSKHGMLRDNIRWEAISWKLGTRHNMSCCSKWYNQLTSPMVAEGIWADVDDYSLLMVLVDLDASCEDEVDWDNLLEDRSGDLCRKRWLQMMRHLGEHGNKTFSEQVEVLAKRYCPDLAEAREALDARPVVD